MKLRVVGVFLLSLLVGGCGAEPMRQAVSANVGVKVEVLTEFDGIRLYRVSDGSNMIYVATSHTELRTQWEVSCGENCTEVKRALTVKR